MSPLARTIAAAWPPVLLHLVLLLGVLLGDHVLVAQQYDQDLFHLQVVRKFEAGWPAIDIANYGTATGPAYHYVLATLAQITGSEVAALRPFSVLFGVGLLVAVAGWCATIVPPRVAALLTMPFATSLYVLGGSLHLVTDNFGWLFVVLALGPLVLGARSALGGLSSGGCSLLAVAVRQNFIWTIGPLLLSGLLASPLGRLLPSGWREDPECSASWRPFLIACLAAVPALVLLGVFISVWGGLVPQRFQNLHAREAAWCAFGYGLALVGLYGPFFLLVVRRPMELLHRHRGLILLFAVGGVVFALLGPSRPDFAAGRHGGLVWALAGAGPVLAERSLVLVLLALVGSVVLGLLFTAALRNRGAASGLVLLCAWLASISTQFVNTQVFQRYYEVPTLLVLCWFAALALRDDEDPESRSAFGPPLLAVILALLVGAKLLNS